MFIPRAQAGGISKDSLSVSSVTKARGTLASPGGEGLRVGRATAGLWGGPEQDWKALNGWGAGPLLALGFLSPLFFLGLCLPLPLSCRHPIYCTDAADSALSPRPPFIFS